jgi:hypothetical protein
MKKNLFTRLLVTACLLGAFSLAKAQDCEAYYPMKAGATIEMTHYSDNDKVTGITQTTVAKESNEGGKHSCTCDVVIKDGKGKEEAKTTYDVSCQNGEFHMDMRSFSMSQQQQQQMQGMENMEIKMESEDLVFPKNLVVGSELPNAHMKMTATMSGMTIFTTTVNVTNRKVTGKESLTTPAGTFSCIIVEEDVETHSMATFHGHNKSWFALGVGMVRSESSHNGKTDGYTLLTKISGN